jgi:hypothetical protein
MLSGQELSVTTFTRILRLEFSVNRRISTQYLPLDYFYLKLMLSPPLCFKLILSMSSSSPHTSTMGLYKLDGEEA